MKKILIVVSSFQALGGVSNHHIGLKPYWKNEIMYEFYGKRKGLPAYVLFPFDLLKYIFKLFLKKIDIVLINPSFRKYQLFRDGLYLMFGKLFNKKIITFIHGWDDQLAESNLKKHGLFKHIYNKSDLIYVLCDEFKIKLIKMGINSPILLTTTKVSDFLIEDFDISNKNGTINTLLFLGRIEKNKGIFETIDTFNILKRKFPKLKLFVVGDGGALSKAKKKVKDCQINDIYFVGRKMNKEIIPFFKNSDLYILPSYGEGMPTSILESMAFGLPIISRPLGGLNDFFEEDKMGHLIESNNPIHFANKIEDLIHNPKKTKDISVYNHYYAKKHFLASSVAKKIESDISNIL